jgi:hypothetical protein
VLLLIRHDNEKASGMESFSARAKGFALSVRLYIQPPRPAAALPWDPSIPPPDNCNIYRLESSCDPYRDLKMKQTNYRFTRKRKIWGARLEILSRRVERWLEEHYKQVFFWFMMLLLFITQVLLWLV